jgi:hypothetical protein
MNDEHSPYADKATSRIRHSDRFNSLDDPIAPARGIAHAVAFSVAIIAGILLSMWFFAGLGGEIDVLGYISDAACK